MKKILYSLGILAVSVLAFTACQKEQPKQDELVNNKLVTITFTAEKAGLATKTAAVEGSESVSFVWTDDDVANIKLFDVGEDNDGNETLTVVANPTVLKESDLLTISAQVAPGAHTFRAVLAGKWTNDGKKPRVSESQSPSSTNFDPSADVLVSEDMQVNLVDSGEETVSTSDLLMTFHRGVVVNKMTLKNLTAGEKLNKVVISSNKNLVSYFNYTPKGDSPASASASGGSKTITLNYINVPVEGTTFPIYFTTIPGTDQSLTVEVTTDQNIYTKSFAEGKTINFNLGQFTKFNFALPAGVANTSLTLPVEDSMDWAMTGGSDGTAVLSVSDLTATQNGKKIYDSSSFAYKGGDGLKLGNGDNVGSITTNNINLSSAFYIAVDAKRYTTDNVKLSIAVDGTVIYTTPNNLTSEYTTYYYNCSAATANSKITISTVSNSGKRAYINNLVIGSGEYVAPPVINVTSNNPLEVANTASTQTIIYTIDNPTPGSALTALSEDAWITNINYATSGTVTFNVAAQESGAPARNGSMVLTYPGAKSKTVIINQAAGEGGITVYKYTFTSKDWAATLNGETADWVNDKSGSGTEARGISIQNTATGAGATSPVSFNTISNITLSLSKSSNGVGSVDVYVGTTKVATQSTFTTTATEYSFPVNNLSGTVSFVVNCTRSTIYVRDIAITALGISDGGSTDIKYYKKVSSISSGKTYIMVDNEYSMIFNSANVAQPSVGIDATSLIVSSGIQSNETTDSYAVTITSVGDKYKVLLSTGQYLVINSSSGSNGSITSNDSGESITINKDNAGFQFISGNRPSRALVYRNGYNFRNYAISNIGANGYGGYFDLYELEN